MIRRLPEDVRSAVRTGVALTSVAQAVEELVLNSIDAEASSISIRVDFSCFKIQVVDNGNGISYDQLPFVGERYCTSKCHKIEDLENLNHFGYRGEALASFRNATSFMEIVTRHKMSTVTHLKCFQNGKGTAISQASVRRPSPGTTVTVHDLFYKLPVRKKCINSNIEMEKVRYRIAGIALMWPRISISLRDDSVGHVILQTPKCCGTLATFSNIFTPARSRKLMEISVQKDEFLLNGLLSTESCSRKDFQFVFVNKRLVLKSSIHKQLNKILSRSSIIRRKEVSNEMSNVSNNSSVKGSPTKQIERYAVYVINVECPFNSYDVTFDPAKTLIEFRDWPKLIHLLQDMVYGFLRENNLISSVDPFSPPLDHGSGNVTDIHENNRSGALMQSNIAENANKDLNVSYECGKRKLAGNTMESLFSLPVCRPQKKNGGRDNQLENESVEGVHEQQRKGLLEKETNTLCRGEVLESCEKVAHEMVEGDKKLCESDKTEGEKDPKEKETISESTIHKESYCQATHVSNKDCSPSGSTLSDHNVRPSSSSECTSESGCEEPIPLKRARSKDSENPLLLNSLKHKEITLTKCVTYTSTLKPIRDMNPLKITHARKKMSEIVPLTLQNLKRSTKQNHLYPKELLKTPINETARKTCDNDSLPSLNSTMLNDSESSVRCPGTEQSSKCNKLDSQTAVRLTSGKVAACTLHSIVEHPTRHNLSKSQVDFKANETADDTEFSNLPEAYSSSSLICIPQKRCTRKESSQSSKLARLMRAETVNEKDHGDERRSVIKSFAFSKKKKTVKGHKSLPLACDKQRSHQRESASNVSNNLNFSGSYKESAPVCSKDSLKKCIDNSHSACVDELPFSMYNSESSEMSNRTKKNEQTPKLTLVLSVPIDPESKSTVSDTGLSINDASSLISMQERCKDKKKNQDSSQTAPGDWRHFECASENNFDNAFKPLIGSEINRPLPHNDKESPANSQGFSNDVHMLSQGFFIENPDSTSHVLQANSSDNEGGLNTSLGFIATNLSPPSLTPNNMSAFISSSQTVKYAQPSHFPISTSPDVCGETQLASNVKDGFETSQRFSHSPSSSITATKTAQKEDLVSETLAFESNCSKPHTGTMFLEADLDVCSTEHHENSEMSRPDMSTPKCGTDTDVESPQGDFQSIYFTSQSSNPRCSQSHHFRNSQTKADGIDGRSPATVLVKDTINIMTGKNGIVIDEPLENNYLQYCHKAGDCSTPKAMTEAKLHFDEDIPTHRISSPYSERLSTEYNICQEESDSAGNLIQNQTNPLDLADTSDVTAASKHSNRAVSNVFVDDSQNSPSQKTVMFADSPDKNPCDAEMPHDILCWAETNAAVPKVDNNDQQSQHKPLRDFQVSKSNGTANAMVQSKADNSIKASVISQKKRIVDGLAVQHCAAKIPKACWTKEMDNSTGKFVYINQLSGHSISEEQWLELSSQGQRDLLAADSTTATSCRREKELTPLSPAEKDTLQSMVKDHLDSEEAGAMSKWREGKQPSYDETAGKDVVTVMAKWNNPVFLNYKPPYSQVEPCPSGSVLKKCFNGLNCLEFTKKMLQTVKVLGQLDNKFIACCLSVSQPNPSSASLPEDSSSLLILFDQHAVHERIRLESLTSDTFEVLNDSKTDRIKWTKLSKTLSLYLNQDDVRLMRAFSEEFERIGKN